ncbi:hypothetical protein KUCAC02_020453, partial [Chaenocephalus aceratus]
LHQTKCVSVSPLRLEKMSGLKDEEEDTSSVSSCLSLKSDWSKEWNPPVFSNEPGPSDTEQRAESPVPSCLSLKSDWSKEWNPPDFSNEPDPQTQ